MRLNSDQARIAQNLRERLSRAAEVVGRQDGTPEDRDPAPGRVRLRGTAELSAEHPDGSVDRLLTARGEFGAQGQPLQLRLFSQYWPPLGMPGESRLRLETRGGQQHLSWKQDGYQGRGSFRADLSFDPGSGECTSFRFHEGPPGMLEAMKEVATSPMHLGLSLGVGLLAGVIAAAPAGPGAAAAVSLVGAGLSFLIAAHTIAYPGYG